MHAIGGRIDSPCHGGSGIHIQPRRIGLDPVLRLPRIVGDRIFGIVMGHIGLSNPWPGPNDVFVMPERGEGGEWDNDSLAAERDL